MPAKGSLLVTSRLKRKCEKFYNENPTKRYKTTSNPTSYTINAPIGLCWDATDWSCAYDSLFVILYNIWSESPETWTKRFDSIENTYLSTLVQGFNIMHQDHSISF